MHQMNNHFSALCEPLFALFYDDDPKPLVHKKAPNLGIHCHQHQ